MAETARPRLDSLDALRGLVMVVMALDHTRDFVGASAMDPRDVANPALFLTRWVTHFCAPVFVFLAGTAAYLYGRKRPADLSRFLWTRGLWLVCLEWTVVRFVWTFDVLPGFLPMQVIWAIGWSMVVLAALSRLPVAAVGAFGVIMIAGHNLLDGIGPERFGDLAFAWTIFHGFGPLAPMDAAVTPFVAYAVVPWVGVMAAGYAFGTFYDGAPDPRRARLLAFGAALVALFVALRAWNGYGDPGPWQPQPDAFATLLSFGNTEKYPPSLLFLLMTLGPSIALLGLWDRGVGAASRWLVTIGRVPLFYYVLHILWIHLATIALTAATGGPLDTLLGGFHPMNKPAAFGYALPVVYAVWLGVVAALYPLCRWFAAVKQRRSDWWLSYL